MPTVGDKVTAQATATPVVAVQDKTLYLPSDFTTSEHRELGLRKGQAFDVLWAIQNIVKAITPLRDRKYKNDRQHKQHTQSGDQIRKAVKHRDRHMQMYEHSRQALISLEALDVAAGVDSSPFPPLTEADLFMKSVRQKRQQWNDTRTEWYPNGDLEVSIASSSIYDSNPAQQEKMIAERPASWLWTELGRLGKLSESEMEDWSSEGKGGYAVLARTWGAEACGVVVDNPKLLQNAEGHAAYAHHKAAMYQRRMDEATQLIVAAGYQPLLKAKPRVIDFLIGEWARRLHFYQAR
ncbi:hypothetical protein B0H10DRAFT_1964240 [Mycena sp. CBHHK59/15]|nr:hypothetical protein B0H10DRAFT_1964240 [Mycena sp. CBHHK59/15]